MLRKILVCLDGASLAEQILRHVTAEAKSCGGHVILLHVVDISSTVYTPTQAFAKPHWQEQLQQEDEKSRQYLESLAERLRSEGIHADAVVLQGLTGQSIVEYADNSHVHLIALRPMPAAIWANWCSAAWQTTCCAIPLFPSLR